MTIGVRALISAAAGALACGAAWGQLLQTQTGHELDSNYQVGAGRYNTSVPPQKLNSQLYITGQVTGLGAFQGPVGYTAGNRFRMDLPSDYLGSFQRQSVGLGDVLSGRTYITRPYLDPSATALPLGGILSGQALPATNVPVPGALSLQQPPKLLLDEATKDYRPLGQTYPPETVTRAYPAGGENLAPGWPFWGAPQPEQPAPGTPMPLPAGGGRQELLTRPGPMALFGIPAVEQREQLARELYEMAQRRQQGSRQQGPEGPGQAGQAAGPIDTRIDTSVAPGGRETTGEGLAPNSGTLGQGLLPTGLQPDRTEPTTITPTPAGVYRSETEALPRPNEDAYADLVRELLRRPQGAPAEGRQGGQTSGGVGLQAPGGLANPLSVPKAADPGLRGGLGSPAPAGAAAKQDSMSSNLVQRLGGGPIVLRELAGRSQDVFNLQMADAGRLLRAGRFYAAADRYELAVLLKPDNPLARLGSSMSLFMAGESLTAGRQLCRAMELFPPIMEVRLDAGAFTGPGAAAIAPAGGAQELANPATAADMFDRRLARLDERVSKLLASPASSAAKGEQALALEQRRREEGPLLALLATYLHYNAASGERHAAAAARSAQVLQAVAAADDPHQELYRAYATLVLTGRRPADGGDR